MSGGGGDRWLRGRPGALHRVAAAFPRTRDCISSRERPSRVTPFGPRPRPLRNVPRGEPSALIGIVGVWNRDGRPVEHAGLDRLAAALVQGGPTAQVGG